MSSALSEVKRNHQDLDINDLGSPDTLRYNVLTFVINEEYERAVTYLKDFLAADSLYPNLALKIERYIHHSIDLIFAVKAKRNFPGMHSLTRTKQQELKEKFKEHFQELKMTIKKIENAQEELRLNDIKSTRLVVKSLWVSIFIIFLSYLILDVMFGLGSTFYIVFDEYVGRSLDWFYQVIGVT